MNKSVLHKFLLFAAGATVGSLVTWKLMGEKYKQMADQEIESMREYYKEKYEDNYEQLTLDDVLDETEEESEIDEEAVEECENVISSLGYVNYADMTKPNEEVDDVAMPYVISPEDFTEIPEYKAISLTYFSDGVLTDNQYTPVEDVDDVVGLDSLDHIGDYEDDAVHVRNDRLKTDFEIILDPRKYSDFINNDSHPTEDE